MPHRPALATWRSAALALTTVALAGCYLSVGFDSDPVDEPLQITEHPQSTTVATGQSARFVVGARGSGLDFQWQRNGVAIAGATGTVYATPPTTIADDGTLFTVRVCDDLACVTSLPALLSVVRSQ